MITKCILCNIEGTNLGEKVDYNHYDSADPSGVSYGIRKVYNYLKCQNCNLFWVKNSDEDYEDMYKTTNYWWDEHKRRGWNSIDEKPRIENDIKYSKLRVPVIKQFITEGKVLEIGCSTGTLIKELFEDKTSNFSCCYGVEPCKEVAKQASEYSGRYVFPHELTEDCGMYCENYYNLVIAIDVLEHLLDPLKHIKIWSNMIVNNGLIFVELPDANCEGAITHGVNWDYSIPTEHPFCYKKEHIIHMFNQFDCKLIHFDNPWTTDRMRLIFRKDNSHLEEMV